MTRWTLLLLATALLGAAPARAQDAWVAGVVTDAETGEPLPGAHVFVSGTLRGDAADRAGRFGFRVVPGPALVTATMLGYGTASTERLLQPGDTLALGFWLTPQPLALGAVEVVDRQDEAWRRTLQTFRPVFLGGSSRADETALQNPEVLHLALEDGTLRARTEAPLVVRNLALGYEITFHDLDFAATGTAWGWDATIAFRDLCAEWPCAPVIVEERERAYAGSVQHFLDALVAGRHEEEGFRVRRVTAPGKSGSSITGAIGRALGLSRGAPPDEVAARPTPYGWEVETGGALRVEYERERDGRTPDGGPQVSWLTAEDERLRLAPSGALLDPDAVVRYGYWDWERVADHLPADYRPPPDR